MWSLGRIPQTEQGMAEGHHIRPIVWQKKAGKGRCLLKDSLGVERKGANLMGTVEGGLSVFSQSVCPPSSTFRPGMGPTVAKLVGPNHRQ